MTSRLLHHLRAAAIFLLLLWCAGAEAASIRLFNGDAPGEGLNDETVVPAVGGNLGRMIGAQRFNAVQRAALIWASALQSDVDIAVDVSFDALPCSPASAVLGQATPTSVQIDFAGAPLPGTFYASALANRLARIDLCPEGSCRDSSDVRATFSSSFGVDCGGGGGWYLGLDGRPPPQQVDLVTVALHELGHGLGFLSLVDVQSGLAFMDMDDVFSVDVEAHHLGRTFVEMNATQRAAAVRSVDDLHLIGPSAILASQRLSSGADASGHILLHAPEEVEAGSSLSHFDLSLSPNQLMEPSLSNANHDIGLALEVLRDIGWVVTPPVCEGDCNGDFRVEVSEVVLAVRAALHESPVDVCLSADGDGDGAIGIGELIRAVRNGLDGCDGSVLAVEALQRVVAGETGACGGDCDGDGRVSVQELILGVNIALGSAALDACPVFDQNGDGRVGVGELIAAVGNALDGCTCPFDLLDESAGSPVGCVFTGTWNSDCGDAGLPAIFRVADGLVGVAVVTGNDSPTLTFVAQTSTGLEANLVGFTFGDESEQLGGSVQLSEDGRHLSVVLDADPEILIDDCPFVRYEGEFDGLESSEASTRTAQALRAAEQVAGPDGAPHDLVR